MMALLKNVFESGEHYVVESIRTKTEIDQLASRPDVFLISIDAHIEDRYVNVTTKRKSSKDNVSFLKFCDDEDLEMWNDNPDKQNLSYCIAKVPEDFRIWNDGTIENLYKKIDAIMAKIPA
jgi:hypothetical protein